MSPTTDKHAWRYSSPSSRWLERQVDPTWAFRWASASELNRVHVSFADSVESALMFGPRVDYGTIPKVSAYFAGPDVPSISSKVAAKYLSDPLSVVLWYNPTSKAIQRLVGRSPIQWKLQSSFIYPRLTVNQSNGLFDRQYATPEEVECLYGQTQFGAVSDVAKPAPVPFEDLIRQLEEG